MRTLSYLSLLLAFVLTACEKNGDGEYDLPEQQAESGLVGTWSLERYDSETSGTADFQGMEIQMEGTGTLAPGSNFQIEFKSNGEAVAVGDVILDVEVDLNGQIMQYQSPGYNIFEFGKYRLADGTLTFTNPDGMSNQADVISLTDNELVLEGTIDSGYDMPGITNETTQHYVQTFIRVP